MPEPIKLHDFEGTQPPRGNSQDREKAERIVEGKVTQKKASFIDKLGVSAGDILEHITMNIVVPEIKGMLFNSIQEGLGRSLYGDNYRSSAPVGRGGYTSYNRMSRDSRGVGVSRSNRQEPMKRRGFDFGDIILDSKADADEILDAMDKRIDRYNSVSVADLYDFLGITGSFTDEDWGWFNLRSAGVRRVREGYILDLPKPEPLR